MLHQAVLPREEDHDAGHLAELDAHRFVVHDVRQRDVGPEEARESEHAAAGQELLRVLDYRSCVRLESDGNRDHTGIMS